MWEELENEETEENHQGLGEVAVRSRIQVPGSLDGSGLDPGTLGSPERGLWAPWFSFVLVSDWASLALEALGDFLPKY